MQYREFPCFLQICFLLQKVFKLKFIKYNCFFFNMNKITNYTMQRLDIIHFKQSLFSTVMILNRKLTFLNKENQIFKRFGITIEFYNILILFILSCVPSKNKNKMQLIAIWSKRCITWKDIQTQSTSQRSPDTS